MTAKELIEKLAKFNPDTEIRYRDLFWENEGYGERAEDLHYLTRRVIAIHMKELDGKSIAVLQ